jgi:protein gp37
MEVNAVNIVKWNPWHGCIKCSVGCRLCSVYESDNKYGRDTANIVINRTQFRKPIKRKKVKNLTQDRYEMAYEIPSGSIINVCETSDFFLEEADGLRTEAWKIIHERNDCLFIITTKRVHRINQCLPYMWLAGWSNVKICVSAENEKNTYSRVREILDLPILHIGICLEPLLEYFDLSPILSSGRIENITVAGEITRYPLLKPSVFKLEWARKMAEQAKEYAVSFEFVSTGNRLKLDNGHVLNIMENDSKELAKFYKMNNYEVILNDIRVELELQSLAENAFRVYNKYLESRQ